MFTGGAGERQPAVAILKGIKLKDTDEHAYTIHSRFLLLRRC